MNPNTWRDMVDRSNELYQSLGDGLKIIEDNEKETATFNGEGCDLPKIFPEGHILQDGDLFPLRPLNPDGIPPYDIVNLIGKKLNRQVKVDNYIRREDIE